MNYSFKNILSCVLCTLMAIGLTTCSKPEWTNPFDIEYNLNLSYFELERTYIEEVTLNWNYDFDFTDGQIYIDKMVNNGDYLLDYDSISITDTTWTDNQIELDNTYKYRLRLVCDKNENSFETPSVLIDIPVPEDIRITFYPAKAQFSWDYALQGIGGYRVYKTTEPDIWNDFVTMYNYNSRTWNDNNFSYETNYYYKLSAYYDGLYSDFSNIIDVKAYSMSWNDAEYEGWEMGAQNGGEIVFDVAIRFNESDLEQYNDMYLTQVNFIPTSHHCDYYIQVWKGGSQSSGHASAGSTVVNQFVTNPDISDWNYIVLDNPVHIDSSQELWLGYRSFNQSGYPVGFTENSPVQWKGNLIYWNDEWIEDSDYNLCIKGVANISQVITPDK